MIAAQKDLESDTDYKLYRGGRETLRLTAQHHTMVKRQGWLLHPDVAHSIKPVQNPQIADVAAGTGIWAIEVAEQYPKADLYALDISKEQYPPSWTCPANAHFDILDVLGDVPDQYQQKFDVVHVRLLLGAGPAVDHYRFVDCFRKLLKPGGWLQWDELAWPNMFRVNPPSKRNETYSLDGMEDYPLNHVMIKHMGVDKKLGWTMGFEKAMQEAGGFSIIRQSHAPILPQLLNTETELNVAVLTDLMSMLVESGRVKAQADFLEIDAALRRLQQDQQDGVLFTYHWTNNIAQKASS